MNSPFPFGFPASVGKETSGLVVQSFLGLAVGADKQGPFFAYDQTERKIVDVNGCVVQGADQFLYRIAVEKPDDLKPGDVIITSDTPTSSLVVVKIDNDHVHGWDPKTQNCVEYCPPTNFFGCRWFIVVVSLIGRLVGHGDKCKMAALLSMLSQSSGSTDDPLMPLLLMQMLGTDRGERAPNDNLLRLLLLLRSLKSEGSQPLLLALLLGGGGALSSLFGGTVNEPPGTDHHNNNP